LIRTNFHAVLPRSEAGLIMKRSPVRLLFQAAADLPGTEPGKLCNQEHADNQG